MIDIPRDFKRGLKAVWAKVAQGIRPSLEEREVIVVRNPYRNIDPLSEGLAYLTLGDFGQAAPPFIPRAHPMPIGELCQLALLWAMAGKEEEAFALARSIPIKFPWLWCRENEYEEEETLDLIAWLSRVCEASRGSTSTLQTTYGIRPLFIETSAIQCALTFNGSHTSLGAIVSEVGEIRAFGPQVLPLSDPRGFGIRTSSQDVFQTVEGGYWASLAASPEVWFETKGHSDGDRIVLDLSFFGLNAETPIAFCFYVKASSAQIGGVGGIGLQPKTLHRYQGVSQPILFGSGLGIESLSPGKMEVIPLAGRGGYWNCEFLAAFEIHPINAKISFILRAIHAALSPKV